MIILLKNKTVPLDSYETHFQSIDLDHVFIPLMKHSPTDTSLRKYLESDEFKQSEAIIITSQRAIEIVNAEIPGLDPDHVTTLKNKISYTVGGATADVLRRTGYTDVRGAENAGNGSILADLMLKEPLNKYVFFTGKKRRDVIPSRLKENGADITEKVVYETTELPDISSRFLQIFNKQVEQGIKPWIVFFSPSYVDPVVETLKKMDRNAYYVASIGPTTEEYLIQNGITPDSVAIKPDAIHLAQAIQFGVPGYYSSK